MKVSSKKVLVALLMLLQVALMKDSAFAAGLLKKGMSGQEIGNLQNDLAVLGHYNYKVTGYFGDITQRAVKDFQINQGLSADGIVGNVTRCRIEQMLGKAPSAPESGSYYKKSWFEGGNRVFSIGKVATVYDIDTGRTFKVKRTFGTNHADCETLTCEDTNTMKGIYGGRWSWNRRAIILDVDGVKIPASMAGMPHAGLNNKPTRAYVTNRSGGFGRGINLDSIKGNGMDGHFCVHLLNSRTHASNRVEPMHQQMVRKAINTLEGRR
ncbi:MAG: peptidoglycan-binding protein [Clostridiales bacterium]|nr:peptidoglycan-binding protein [Clostridiales bacterium]